MVLIFTSITADLFALLAITIGVAYFYVKHKFNYWERRGVKYAKPHFPFGTLQPSFLQQISPVDLLRNLYEKDNEPIVGMFAGVRPALLIRDPEILQQILIKDFSHFNGRGMHCNEINDPLSGNLFSLNGEKWRNLRGKLSPTFTSGKLKAMFSTLVDCGAPLIKYMDTVAAAEETINVMEILPKYTTNVIASVAFGIDIDCITNPNHEFRTQGRKIFAPTLKNGLRAITGFFFPKLLPFLKIKMFDQDVEDFMLSLVKQNMEHREKNNVVRKDFFQLLVQLRNTGKIEADGLWDTKITNDEKLKTLSINECAAQSFIFFAAGFETSSTTMSFALYEMAKNPEMQRKAQQEIDTVLKQHNDEWTFECVSEMKYLDLIIDETLRKHPPAPILIRECNREWKIPNTNVTIEPGTSINISGYGFHYDEKYYPNPQKFDPERFTPANSRDKNFINRPYLPFGEGPRNCIGMRLGKMQSKVGLIIMLQNYNFQLSGNTTRELKLSPNSFLLVPEGGIELKCTKRTRT